VTRRSLLAALLTCVACRRSEPIPTADAAAAAPRSCGSGEGPSAVRLEIGSALHLPTFIWLKLPDGPLSLFPLGRPPFGLTPADLCSVTSSVASAAIGCAVPHEGDPLRLDRPRATIRVDGEELALVVEGGAGPQETRLKPPTGGCWSLAMAGHSVAEVESALRHGFRGNCAQDAGTGRETAASLSYRPRRDASGESLEITLVVAALHLRSSIAQFYSVHSCRAFTAASRDAAWVRCESSEDGATLEVRAYAVPGQLWTSDAVNSPTEGAIATPCDVTIRFQPSDLCASAGSFCRPRALPSSQ
jgi:hypothetical protein